MNNATNAYHASFGTAIALALGLSLTGCGKEEQVKSEAAPEQRSTLITTTQPELSDIEVIEASLGSLETTAAPSVAAEVAGKVISLGVDVGQSVKRGQGLARIDDKDFRIEQEAAQSEVKRVEALIRSQQKQVKRYEAMVKENFVTESLLDEALAQLDALKEQLAGAKARLEIAKRNLSKVEITSPTDGQVEERLVSAGDYVKPGTPLFRITHSTTLQAHLPFPETVAARLKPGLAVHLRSPLNPEHVVEGLISEIRPTVGRVNKALDVIVELKNPGGWQAGGSVRGEVVVDVRKQSVMVPEISVVRRPAGSVVYTIDKGVAHQKIVITGVHQNGMVEIISGIKRSDTIAKDGAAYLTEGAAVKTGGGQPT